ncbi:CIA30-domain-containing protein [Massarina eburnea CBS 473.64]|uniref:CIA30-domain-containing protein n=1 Tax=Massarina eburnea CBS 473.64 TaxID=1395130 RepID=A0A6A6RRN8_9PLEO|nr:CIA30-domain-containing protein [Massarina eburnea CBS 473.64]
MGKENDLVLFGGDSSWKAADWIASDDRVRGGKSQSYLDCSGSGDSARFHGTLDIKTLGGAGFASQRTTTDSETWDLSDYDGIQLHLGKSDGKRYTFILKDELLPRNPENGRDQATTSWEYDFGDENDVMGMGESSYLFVPWGSFKPTYRGKEKKDAGNLDKKNVKRFSIMMRSFFGDQEGDFSLTIKSIKAVSKPTDLEKGFTNIVDENGSKDFDRKSAFRVPSLVRVVALGVLAYGVCTFACPLIHEMYMKRH